MKEVNFKKLLLMCSMAIAFMLMSAIESNAQTLVTQGGTPGGAAPAKNPFITSQSALAKLTQKLPLLYNQLNAFTQGTSEYKKKLGEVMAYKLMIQSLNQGNTVQGAYNENIKVMATYFNLNVAGDIQQLRTAQTQLYTLLTTP